MGCAPHSISAGPFTLEFGARTLLMGIINVTPDSFSGDGIGADPAAAAEQAVEFAAAGADIIDVGGESTRPGAERVSAEEQIRRTEPAVRAIARAVSRPISIDTTRAEVAAAALDAGAHIINDVSALREDPALARLAAERQAPVVLMHMLGTPATMQADPRYEDVVRDVRAFLAERIRAAMEAGIAEERILIDPGIGFGKTVEHNLEILRRLSDFRALGRPILVGTSRKSMIRRILGTESQSEVVWGTAATVACAIRNGADVVRVHDVAEMAAVAKVADAICRSRAQAGRRAT